MSRASKHGGGIFLLPTGLSHPCPYSALLLSPTQPWHWFESRDATPPSVKVACCTSRALDQSSINSFGRHRDSHAHGGHVSVDRQVWDYFRDVPPGEMQEKGTLGPVQRGQEGEPPLPPRAVRGGWLWHSVQSLDPASKSCSDERAGHPTRRPGWAAVAASGHCAVLRVFAAP
jgi:hypothetical protein